VTRLYGTVFAGLTLGFLLLAAAAGAASSDSYSASVSPTAVQPSATGSYAITLHNQGPDSADSADITIPSGFSVNALTLSASVSGGGCPDAIWRVAIDPIDSSKINLSSPNAGAVLCDRGTLTVAFEASSASDAGTYTWTTELFAHTTAFTLTGAQPQTTVDGTPPPTPTIDSRPPDPSNESSPSFSFSDSEAGVSFQCQLDDGGFFGCASPKTYTLGDGPHTFQVRAADPALNPSDAASYQWTIDTTPPPVPTIDSRPPDPSNESSPSFTFSDSEAGVSFQCQLDGGGFFGCASPKTYTLGDGPHTFQVRAADPALNLSDAASYQWTIDTTPPPVPTIGPHASLEGTSTTSFTFSSAGATSFECRVDAAAFSPCSSGDSLGPFADGSHTFFVRALDELGNASAAASSQWTIDTIAPQAPVITGEPQSPSGSSSASFSFTDADPTVTFQCQLDGAGFSDCSSGSANYSDLLDGPHTFGVKAADPIGHESDLTTYSWAIDTVYPVVTLNDKPPPVTNQTSASFSFSSTRPAGAYQCDLDGGGFGICTSPRVYSGLRDGSHTFSVQATSLGNTGPTTGYTWTIDTVAPETTITSAPPATSRSGSATFTFTSSEAGSTFACSVDTAGFTPCTSPQTYSGLGDGAHTFRVEAVDQAGNADTTPATYSWQTRGVGPEAIDHTPPGNVRRLQRNVGYGILKLTWTKPPDADFDHVAVFVSTRRKSPPRTLVYKGNGTRYTNKRFKNGLYYRYSIVSYDHAANASRGVAAVVPPSILLRSPRDGDLVRSPPLFVWRAVAKATFYNVQLYYGPEKVLSAWPNREKLALARTWTYAGRRFQLMKGAYRWYVWPAFGPRSKSHYGQLLGQGTFRMG